MRPAASECSSDDEKLFGLLMERWFRRWRVLGFTTAATPEEYYRFHPSDIERAYTYKHGEGEGVWFRLHNGRVFDRLGHPDDEDPSLYEAAMH